MCFGVELNLTLGFNCRQGWLLWLYCLTLIIVIVQLYFLKQPMVYANGGGGFTTRSFKYLPTNTAINHRTGAGDGTFGCFLCLESKHFE